MKALEEFLREVEQLSRWRRERGRLRFPLPVETLRDAERPRDLNSSTSGQKAEMIGTGLVFLMLTAAVSPAQSQGIILTNNGAILACSEGEDNAVKWKKGTEELTNQGNKSHTVPADHGIVKGEFSCEYDDVTHLFYINVKVCENCYELSSFMVVTIILGDLLITGAVILSVYMCVPKNTGSTQQKASKPRTQSAPPVPNPDYQVLNQRTRTTDVYSALK